MRIKRALSVDVSVAEKKKKRLPHGIFPPSFEKEGDDRSNNNYMH
jgi:hypothetical protein